MVAACGASRIVRNYYLKANDYADGGRGGMGGGAGGGRP